MNGIISLTTVLVREREGEGGGAWRKLSCGWNYASEELRKKEIIVSVGIGIILVL